MLGRSWARRALRQSVVVHLTTGDSLRGVLAAQYDDALVLRHAALLGAEGASLDGDVAVPRTKVNFIQQLPPSEP